MKEWIAATMVGLMLGGMVYMLIDMKFWITAAILTLMSFGLVFGLIGGIALYLEFRIAREQNKRGKR